MFLYIISSLLLSLSLTLFLNANPIRIGFWILLLAITSSIFISFIIHSWFGLILFLIYIRGMLVMFSYFTAISPNQLISLLPWKIILIFTLPISFILFYLLILPIKPFIPSKFIFISLFSKINTTIFIFLGLTLFIILIAVVKIAFLWKGPLRPYKTH